MLTQLRKLHKNHSVLFLHFGPKASLGFKMHDVNLFSLFFQVLNLSDRRSDLSKLNHKVRTPQQLHPLCHLNVHTNTLIDHVASCLRDVSKHQPASPDPPLRFWNSAGRTTTRQRWTRSAACARPSTRGSTETRATSWCYTTRF